MRSSGQLLSLRFTRLALVLCVSCVTPLAAFAQRTTGTLRGQVTDQAGAVVVGATVTVTDATSTAQNANETAGSTGNTKTAQTDDEGRYTIGGLIPGAYLVQVEAEGFATFENEQVEVLGGERDRLDITLSIAVAAEQVTVEGEAPLSTDPANNADATVLRGSDLDSLPDDPDELAAALQALAGPAAGPEGGQFYIDGFTGGRLPPKESIREIRINSNPFAAEYDRLGFGRVEIFTKPGTDKLRGQTFFNFGDESLNSRNPFVINRNADTTKRPPYQQRRFGGNLSGSIVPKRASFFIDFERRDIDDNSVINARTLDPGLSEIPFNTTVITGNERTTFSPRVDYQINANNTLIGRYSYTRGINLNFGLGDLTLPELAFDLRTAQHTFQITETAVIGTTVNEARFQFISEDRVEDVENTRPTISVLDAFTFGSPGIGFGSRNPEKRYEFQNFTSFSRGRHAFKLGGRVRHANILDISPDNFIGAFTFTTLEQYRDTILDRAGVRPAQFRINAGNPEARVSQTDLGIFLQDDWRVNNELTLSLGLRYETQSNIDSNLNFAPRLSFAYSPGAGGGSRPQTVFRGGFGVFYERFGENLVLQTNRINPENQLSFILNGRNNPDGTPVDPVSAEILDRVQFAADGTATNLPTIDELRTRLGASNLTTRVIADDLSAPYTLQSSLSVERQLPFGITLSVAYINSRTLHLLRSRNINAPLLTSNGSFARPLGDIGNVFQYESSGIADSNQLRISANSRFGGRFSFGGFYTLGSVKSDSEGANSFPANNYDLRPEYGRSFQDVRHRFFGFGSYNAPFGINLNPLVILSSGRPFNITSGFDQNGDTQFLDRPTFAQLTSVLAARGLSDEFAFDRLADDEIIPRNFGRGPAFFSVNLRVGKTFGFGGSPTAATATSGGARGGAEGSGGRANRGGGGGGQRGGGGRGGAGGGFGGGQGGGGRRGGGGGPFGGGASDNRYSLNFSVQFQNLFNRTNLDNPIGNLNSSRLGQSIRTVGGFGGGGGDISAGNRRIEAQVRFSF